MSKREMRSARALIALISSVVIAGCPFKDSTFLGPPSVSQTSPLDLTPPIIFKISPDPKFSGPFNINSFQFSVADSVGPNNAPASGPDFSSVLARIGTQTIPLTRAGSVFTGSLVGIPDGSTTIHLSGADLRGNGTTVDWAILTKRVGPTINFTSTPPPTQSSAAPSVSISFAGTVADPYFGTAVGAVYRPGTDNVCGTADDVLASQGSAGGQVSGNSWDYTSSILANGTFSQTFTAFNGVSVGGTPVTGRYCVGVTASDKAVNGTGAASPNTTTKFLQFDITWNPLAATTGSIAGHVLASGTPVVGAVVSAGGRTAPTGSDGSYRIDQLTPGTVGVAVSNLPSNVSCSPVTQQATVVAGQVTTVDYNCTTIASLSVTATYRHLTTTSEVCLQILGTPGSTYTGSASGPGVISNGTFTGALDASGFSLVRVGINQFGTYTGGVNSGSQGRTWSINVTSAAGTCPAPPP